MATVKRARGGARLRGGVAALTRIGEDLERRWSARGYRRRCFHDLAAECLRAASFHRQFVAGPKFIHRVWHLDRPTVTLVARTVTRRRGLRQYSYYAEGLAVRYRSGPPIEFQRRLELMRYLFRRRHPRRVELAEELLARARLAAIHAARRTLEVLHEGAGRRARTRRTRRASAAGMPRVDRRGARGRARGRPSEVGLLASDGRCTWKALGDYAKQKKCCQPNKWDPGWGGMIDAFNGVGYGTGLVMRASEGSDYNPNAKRILLGVPTRYPGRLR